MGCFWSDNPNPDPNGTKNKNGGSSSNGPSRPDDRNLLAGDNYAEDVHNQSKADDTAKERELLHNIVNQTRRDFIRVVPPTGFDESAFAAREANYKKQLPAVMVAAPVMTVTSHTKAVPETIIHYLSTASVSRKDVEWMAMCAESTRTGLDEMQTQDTGKLVFTFEEL
eukprot:gb/GEZN01022175.1/.p1 GENE.gb/GEZN01022175.1/~~gb/GEZN01022175.1/.p1  ORF type:complete len:168 (+),score=15.59 gb/GEZN01022175.1/:89-592(+)